GPPPPPALGASRETRAAPRYAERSGRPGEAVAPLGPRVARRDAVRALRHGRVLGGLLLPPELRRPGRRSDVGGEAPLAQLRAHGVARDPRVPAAPPGSGPAAARDPRELPGQHAGPRRDRVVAHLRGLRLE